MTNFMWPPPTVVLLEETQAGKRPTATLGTYSWWICPDYSRVLPGTPSLRNAAKSRNTHIFFRMTCMLRDSYKNTRTGSLGSIISEKFLCAVIILRGSQPYAAIYYISCFFDTVPFCEAFHFATIQVGFKMKHGVAFRKFSRTSSHRDLMLR